MLVPHPILPNEELAAIKHLDYRGWKTKTIDITYPQSESLSRGVSPRTGPTRPGSHHPDALNAANSTHQTIVCVAVTAKFHRVSASATTVAN